MNKFVKNIPNGLSIFRLLSIPFFLYFSYKGNREVATILFIVGALSDTLDGFMARALKVTSVLGRKLDSIADFPFYTSAIIALYFLFPNDISEIFYIATWILGLHLSTIAYAFLKHGRIPFAHLIGPKASGVAYSAAVLYALLFGFNMNIFYIVIVIFAIGTIERLAFYILMTDESQEELISVFQLIKLRKEINK